MRHTYLGLDDFFSPGTGLHSVRFLILSFFPVPFSCPFSYDRLGEGIPMRESVEGWREEESSQSLTGSEMNTVFGRYGHTGTVHQLSPLTISRLSRWHLLGLVDCAPIAPIGLYCALS